MQLMVLTSYQRLAADISLSSLYTLALATLMVRLLTTTMGVLSINAR